MWPIFASGIVAVVQEGTGPRPYDVATRRLIEGDPEGWLAWIGLPPDGPVESIESDVGTVLAAVDKVLRVEGPAPWIAHLELQSRRDPRLPARMVQYNALLLHRHQVVVESTVILLRPEADGPELTGRFEQHGPTGFRTISFGYHVIRLWERPVEEILGGSLGILPLAPLADVEPAQLPGIVSRLDARFSQEAPPTVAEELRAATFLLLGLRYDPRTAREVTRTMSWLQDSSTYHALLDEGRVDEARRLILALGTEKFGTTDQSVVTRIESIEDLDRLELLVRRILTAKSWTELLDPGGEH